MFLEGDGGMFEVTPPEGVNFASFLIRVRNPTLLDFEKVKGTLMGPGEGESSALVVRVVVVTAGGNTSAPPCQQ